MTKIKIVSMKIISIIKVLPHMEDHQFTWILWYIWKCRNNKVFSNMDIDPMNMLKLAET